MGADYDGLTVIGLIDALLKIKDGAGHCPVYSLTGDGPVPVKSIEVDFERDSLVMRMPGDKYPPIVTTPVRVTLGAE